MDAPDRYGYDPGGCLSEPALTGLLPKPVGIKDVIVGDALYSVLKGFRGNGFDLFGRNSCVKGHGP